MHRSFLTIARTYVVAMIAGFFLIPQVNAQSSRFDAWQVGRPFTLTTWNTGNNNEPGYAGWQPGYDIELFLGSGLNTILDVRGGNSPNFSPFLRDNAQAAGVTILLRTPTVAYHDFSTFQTFVGQWQSTWSNYVGSLLADEPSTDQYSDYRDRADWLRANYPDELIMISHNRKDPTQVAALLDGIGVDVYIAQMYPFGDDNAPMDHDDYAALDDLIEVCKTKSVTLWMWNQSASWAATVRQPSESDFRAQRFVELAYGVKGISDFSYDIASGESGMAGYEDTSYVNSLLDYLVPGTDVRNPLYFYAFEANREVARIGASMVKLSHVRTYHVDDGPPAVHAFSETATDGLTTGKLTGISGDVSSKVLVGFFRDSNNDEYFLVVNKHHGGGLDADSTTQVVTLTFNGTVSSAQRLSRLGLQVEDLAVIGDQLVITLPGGTGDLFKYDTGNPFAGATSCSDVLDFDRSAADLYSDCRIDMLDFGILAGNWLGCSLPDCQ